MNTAFILAAGFGTRLRPLTAHRPKPLVPICGVPLLSYALVQCHHHGLTKVVVNAHWLADQLRVWEGEWEGVEVTLSVEEPDILGTGGGLKKVEDQLAERFVVLNGDVLQSFDLTALLEAVPEGGGALALRAHPDVERYGHVSADETGTVVKMRDFAATEPRGAVRSDTHFTGIHAMHRGLLEHADTGFSGILRTAYTRTIGQRTIRGVRVDGPWLDIGDPEAYLATNLAVLRREISLPLDPFERAGPVPPGVEIRGNAWIGPGAEIAQGAVLEDAVVGAGARVGPVELVRSVVWDGVEVEESLRESIAYGPGLVHGLGSSASEATHE